jgi:hypothetical protein
MTLKQQLDVASKSLMYYRPFFYNTEIGAEVDLSIDRAKFEKNLGDAYKGLLSLPFNRTNGGLKEHLGLTLKYPMLNLVGIIHSAVTVNIPSLMIHCFLLAIHLIILPLGLITRTLASLVENFEKPNVKFGLGYNSNKA